MKNLITCRIGIADERVTDRSAVVVLAGKPHEIQLSPSTNRLNIPVDDGVKVDSVKVVDKIVVDGVTVASAETEVRNLRDFVVYKGRQPLNAPSCVYDSIKPLQSTGPVQPVQKAPAPTPAPPAPAAPVQPPSTKTKAAKKK